MAPRGPHILAHASTNLSSNASDSSITGAQSVEVFTLDIPNPEWLAPGASNLGHRITNSSLGYHFLTNFDIRTLSTVGAGGGNDVTGLLYVPTLDDGNPCINASAPFIPQNATRRANLPATDYDLIAIAPWMSSECSLDYMKAARGNPTRGFMFFLPNNGSNPPPETGDPMWNIGDGGKWKGENGFPVYVLPGQDGANLIGNSSLYSGNVTDVPHGNALTEIGIDAKDYVRLFVDIDTGKYQ